MIQLWRSYLSKVKGNTSYSFYTYYLCYLENKTIFLFPLTLKDLRQKLKYATVWEWYNEIQLWILTKDSATYIYKSIERVDSHFKTLIIQKSKRWKEYLKAKTYEEDFLILCTVRCAVSKFARKIAHVKLKICILQRI